LIEELEKAGVVEKGLANKFAQTYEYNVPFYREFLESESGGGNRGGTGRTYANLPKAKLRMKGSHRTITNPIFSLIKDTYTMMNLAERTKVGRCLYDLAKQADGMGEIVEVDIAPDMYGVSFPLEEIAKTLETAGVDIDSVDMEQIATVFRTNYFPRGKEAREYIVIQMVDGKPKLMKINDPELYEAMLSLDGHTSDLLITMEKLAGADLVKLFKRGVTQTPSFFMRNMLRDPLSAMVFSDAGIGPIDIAKGLLHAIRQDEVYWKFKASGGSHGTMFTHDVDSCKRQVKRVMRKYSPHMSQRMLNAVLENLTKVMESGELGSRIAEFEKTIKEKGNTPEGVMLGTERARDVTIDFSRAGTITREINKVEPFYNPAVQEINKIYRSFRDHPFRTTLRALTFITLPTLLLFLANRDNEYYWELPEWRRDDYWNIPVGGGKYFIPIPIPFLMGALFKTIPERIMGAVTRDNDRAFDGIVKAVISSALPGVSVTDFKVGGQEIPIPLPVPLLLTSMMAIYANKNTYTGQPIIPEREKGLPKEYQYGSYTSETAKILGKVFNASPRNIDYLIKSYFGGVGQLAVKANDVVLENLGVVTPAPKASSPKNIPVVGDFYADELSNSIDRFYRDKEKDAEQYNGERLRREKGLEPKMTNREFQELRVKVSVQNKIASALSKMRTQQRNIEQSKDLTPEQKANKLRRIEIAMTNAVRYVYGKQKIKE